MKRYSVDVTYGPRERREHLVLEDLSLHRR